MTQYAKVRSYPYGPFGNGARCVTSFGKQGFRGDELYWPWYCDVSNSGDIAVADTDNNRIQVFQPRTYTSVFPPFGGQGVAEGQFSNPKSVKYSAIPGTSLAVADTGNRRVSLLRINFLLGQLEHVFSFGQTLFKEPADIAIDRRNGNIVVVDTGLSRATIHDQKGKLLGELEQKDYELRQPSAAVITHDGKSDIYVSDTGNHCIRVYKCNGDYVGKFGKFGTGIGEFNTPRGLAIDRKGYLFVADELNNRVQMFSPDLMHVTEAVGSIPLPKGVAAGFEFVVTCADQTGFVKIYNS